MHFLVQAWDVRATTEGPANAARPAEAQPSKNYGNRARWCWGRGSSTTPECAGSLVIVDYPTREEVDAYLANEPFVTQGVWDRVEVHPLWVPDFYLKR